MAFGAILRWLFERSKSRGLRRYYRIVAQINALEPSVGALTQDQLRLRTAEFREQYRAGTPLEAILPEAFACVREAARRVLGQRHYDVQLVGGIVLHEGKIAEMKTGEGKTLVATLPAYLNALSGEPVHIVTVNDYLASRDACAMGPVYECLGLKCGCITGGMSDRDRQRAYEADVTYGTNNELGFDYLRDNMKYAIDQMVQRGHGFALVDEVDSILIDEARTPLIISGPTQKGSDFYQILNKLVDSFNPQDYDIDEKNHAVTLTEEGNEHAESLLRQRGLLKSDNLYDPENILIVHHLNEALKAHKLFKRNKDYIVRNDRVVIIDEFTGRMMEGRRYSDGLHQALEAKEGVTIQEENQTLASTTFQNYFRMYEKLSGMTGTAATEANEFLDIYKLEVVEVPTHMPIARKDLEDDIYRTAEEKYRAVVQEVKLCLERKQPVLIGTTSIEKSDVVSGFLKGEGIAHNVLNARYHEKEAHIIAQAGAPGAVTIATNMAGRGTDIQLGGAPPPEGETELFKKWQERREQAVQAGGLYVIGTERHESRRIDNQLRGRSGRQGDPGRSKFFLSLEDDLLRIFGSQKLDPVLRKLGLGQGEAISHPLVSRMLEKAQKKVEAHNFEIRKNILQYDDVANEQRKIFFENRTDIMLSEDVHDVIRDFALETAEEILDEHVPHQKRAYFEQWNKDGLKSSLRLYLNFDLDLSREMSVQDLRSQVIDHFESVRLDRQNRMGAQPLQELEKTILLQTFDNLWREHIVSLEHLRQSINLRAYGQRDPLNEYKKDAFELFGFLLRRIRQTCTHLLSHIQIEPAPAEHREASQDWGEDGRPIASSLFGGIPRNAKCPCGSGRKYKHCHGGIAPGA